MRRFVVLFVFIFSVLLLFDISFLAQSTNKPLLPEQVLDKAVEASGGRAALAKIKTLHVKGDVYIQTLGWRRVGSFESFSDDSGKYSNRSELDGHIIRRTGFDGKDLWYADQMLMPAPRGTPLKGISDERTTHRFLLTHRFFPLADWRHYYNHVELMGRTNIGRKTAIVIRGTLPDGTAHNLYFDSERFLLLREEYAGRIKFEKDDEERAYVVRIDLSDYKITDGIEFARERLVQTQYGTEKLVLTKVETSVPLKDGYSAKPN